MLEGRDKVSTCKAEIVLLSSSAMAEVLLEAMVQRGLTATWCPDFREMVLRLPIPSLSVLVIDLEQERKGSLLAAVGRMALEYPRVQKVAILEHPPSLPVATYLTACAVELVRTRLDRASLEEIVFMVSEARERQAWSLAAEIQLTG